jgi:hypothetical protein
VKDPSRARVTGPLERYAPGFVAELARLGYTGNSASGQMFVMGHLSRWLAAEGLDTSGLTPEVADRFLAARRAAGYVLYLSPKALVPLLTYLRSSGVIPPAPAAAPASPVEALLDRYRRYLVTERGLTPATARGYADSVRPFLAGREKAGVLDLAGLTAAEVTMFVVQACPGQRKGTAEADGDRAAVAAGLSARRRRDRRAAGLGRARCCQLAAGRPACCAGAGPGRRAAGQL